MAKNATHIYALCDPTTGEIRYIGKSVAPQARLRSHMWDVVHGDHSHRSHWIRSLGAAPIMLRLALVSNEIGLQVERQIIALYRASGTRLTNLTDGGEGTLGCKKSAETRAKISATKRAKRKQCTPEHKALISAVHRGKVVPPEIRQRMSAGRVGMKFSNEHRLAMSLVRRGKPWTEARRAAQSARGHSNF